MRHFRPHRWVKLPRLQQLLNVGAQLCKPGVIILIAKHRQHVVEHISNHLNLHTRLQFVIFHSNFRVNGLLLLKVGLLLLNYLVQILNFIVDIAVVGLYVIKSLLHLFVEFIQAGKDCRVVRMWFVKLIGLLLRIARVVWCWLVTKFDVVLKHRSKLVVVIASLGT